MTLDRSRLSLGPASGFPALVSCFHPCPLNTSGRSHHSQARCPSHPGKDPDPTWTTHPMCSAPIAFGHYLPLSPHHLLLFSHTGLLLFPLPGLCPPLTPYIHVTHPPTSSKSLLQCHLLNNAHPDHHVEHHNLSIHTPIDTFFLHVLVAF